MSTYHFLNNSEKECYLNYNNLHLDYIPDFLSLKNNNFLLQRFKKSIAWENDSLKIMGKNIISRRKVALYGSENVSYKYSGKKKYGHPWTDELLDIKEKIELVSNENFNSVLLNNYEDGDVYMGWHSDDEKELGSNPTIASLSLGEPRDFLFKHKFDKKIKKFKINLKNGSLLIMKGKTQHFWSHALPKRRTIRKRRINLTFRNILNA